MNPNIEPAENAYLNDGDHAPFEIAQITSFSITTLTSL
jgi:hypothetical protein